ncbi:MAG: response regulator, partial [Gemmatimonadales bacterium]|nr:response regulator [Gemmatimonadales bacterium]
MPAATPYTPHPTPRVLIADDQSDVLHALRLLLKQEGYEVESASSPGGVLAAVEKHDFDAALVDMNYQRDTTGGLEGLDLLSRLKVLDSTLPVVMMTAWGSVEGAVEAMRRGARDYIEKPWDNARLLATLRTQVELGRALKKSQRHGSTAGGSARRAARGCARSWSRPAGASCAPTIRAPRRCARGPSGLRRDAGPTWRPSRWRGGWPGFCM